MGRSDGGLAHADAAIIGRDALVHQDLQARPLQVLDEDRREPGVLEYPAAQSDRT